MSLLYLQFFHCGSHCEFPFGKALTVRLLEYNIATRKAKGRLEAKTEGILAKDTNSQIHKEVDS